MAAASASELGKLVAEHVRGAAFEPARELGDRHVWRMGDQEVDVVVFAGELGQLVVERVEHSVRSVLQPRRDRCGERFATVLDAEHEMDVQRVDAVGAGTGSGARDGIVAGRRYRLQLTGGQQRQAARIAGCWRAVWNAALGQRRVVRQLRRPAVWGVQQMGELPGLRRSEGFEWLGEDAIAQSLQQTLRDLDTAYRRYFAGLGGCPRLAQPHDGPAVGIDRGVAASVALSTGALCRCPELRGHQAERLRRLSRKAGRQETAAGTVPTITAGALHATSARWIRSPGCARETRIRNDFLHKLSTELANSHGLIVIEDLRIKNLTGSAKGTLAQPGVNVAQKRANAKRDFAARPAATPSMLM